MTHVFDELIAPHPSMGGLQRIRVSRWSADGQIWMVCGDYPHQTTILLSAEYAERVGWALLRAESRREMPLDGEPDND